MSRQPALFPAPAKPRAPRLWRMHVNDAGICSYGRNIAHFVCARCGHDAGWLPAEKLTEAKRGIPCPVCNASGGAHD